MAWPTATWIANSASSWRTWSRQWKNGPMPRRLPPRGNRCATSLSVLPLPPSRPDGRRCSRPEIRDSLRAIARELGIARDAVGKYLKAERRSTKLLRAKDRAKADALAQSQIAADYPG